MQDIDLSSISPTNLLQNAAILTVVLAFAGYLVTFMSARMLARRRDKLRLVNKRLNEFYGPLYVASHAGNIAYRSLLNKQGKTQCHPITDAEMKEWVLWMTTIFMPLNDVREKVIIEKAYLIVEEHMPQCLLEFVTHVVGYKAVLAKWAEGDYSERRSTIGWPPEFDLYVKLLQSPEGRTDPAIAQSPVASLLPDQEPQTPITSLDGHPINSARKLQYTELTMATALVSRASRGRLVR
jgi:hypothetical protein